MPFSAPHILDDPEIHKLLARYAESQGLRVQLADNIPGADLGLTIAREIIQRAGETSRSPTEMAEV
jgi:hypothetical protein